MPADTVFVNSDVLNGQLSLLLILHVFVKHGLGLGLFSFLPVECYGVGYSLAFMTFSRPDGLRINLQCMLNK